MAVKVCSAAVDCVWKYTINLTDSIYQARHGLTTSLLTKESFLIHLMQAFNHDHCYLPMGQQARDQPQQI